MAIAAPALYHDAMRTLCRAFLLLLVGCGFEPSGGNDGLDAAAIDAADSDSVTDDDAAIIDAVIDAAVIDTAVVDAAIIDAAIIDAAIIDAAIIDAAIIDAAIIDAAIIDAAIIDARLIDAQVTDARAPCPGTYTTAFNGSHYRFATTATTIGPAAVDCNDDLGGGRTHLATFEVAADMDPAISAVNPGNSAEPFVGASCTANDCSVMSAWTWTTGSAVDATLWEAGQPNNGATQKIAAVRRIAGLWTINNVDAATATRPYICECDP